MIRRLNNFLDQFSVFKVIDEFMERWAISLGMILFVVFMFVTTFNTYQVVKSNEEQARQDNMILCRGLSDTRQTIRDVLAVATSIGVDFQTSDPELKRYLNHRGRRNAEVIEAVEDALQIPPECVEHLQEQLNEERRIRWQS